MAYTTIDKGSKYFNTITYTGTGSTQSITGVGFQPDWVWIKQRSAARSHVLYDVIRGATKDLRSNDTTAEATDAATLSSFNADGFTVVTDDKVNVSSGTYASWNWLANGAGVSNTSGSITSTVSANTTAGFSIVSYTGTGANATVGHGLGVAPKMIITKVRSASGYNWSTYHSSLGADKVIWLNLTNASTSDSGFWNNTTPTSSVFSIGTQGDTNGSSQTIIAYCFAEIKGFSKFSSYTGNNSNDGTFVYLGFKPAFILIKATPNTQFWTLLDNKRDTYNVATLGISPNSSDSESTFNTARGPHNIDFVSNGFKFRTDNSGLNGTVNYIYMAFAENPFVSSTGIPCTAR